MISTSISPGHARLVLRIYFIVLMAAISYLAGRVFLFLAKLRVLRRGSVPVPNIVGFLSGFDLLESVWSLRTLPGGKVGYAAMILVFVVGKLSDLLTTQYVHQVLVESRCSFDTGLVFNTSGSELFTGGGPPFNGMPYIVVHNSQYFSLNNNCSTGIFKKVNRNENFCAADIDILGSWHCETGPTIEYPAGSLNADITSDLQERNLLSSAFGSEVNSFSGELSWFGNTGSFDHFVSWSSSAASDVADVVWSVSAAVQTNWRVEDPISMLSISCNVDAPNAATVIEEMGSWNTLKTWVPIFQGLMYYGSFTPVISDPALQLELLLNTIVMIQGGSNILVSTPDPGDDHTIGCKTPATHIPSIVEALVVLVAVLFLLVIFCVIVLLRQIKLDLKVREGYKKEALEEFPYGVGGWAALAAKERSISDGIAAKIAGDNEFSSTVPVAEKELKRWEVGFRDRNDERLRILSPRDESKDESNERESDARGDAMDKDMRKSDYP